MAKEKIAAFKFRANGKNPGDKPKVYKAGDPVTDPDHIKQGAAMMAVIDATPAGGAAVADKAKG